MYRYVIGLATDHGHDHHQCQPSPIGSKVHQQNKITGRFKGRTDWKVGRQSRHQHAANIFQML